MKEGTNVYMAFVSDFTALVARGCLRLNLNNAGYLLHLRVNGVESFDILSLSLSTPHLKGFHKFLLSPIIEQRKARYQQGEYSAE